MTKTTAMIALGAAIALSLLLGSMGKRPAFLDQARLLHESGVEHYQKSDYHLALEPLQRSFALRKEHLGSVHADTINTAEYLLTCLDSNGDDEEALSFAKAYLGDIERLSGKESVAYAEIETLAGAIQMQLNEIEAAIQSLRHAKDIQVLHHGEKSEHSFLSMHNLNLALAQSGHVEEAISGEEKLLSLRREVLGSKHRETIKSMTNLAFALSKQGDLERAKKLHEESLELRKEVFGKDHPETHVEMVNLAVCYDRLGRVEEGIELCREGYAFFLQHYPAGHPDIRWAALNLRNLLGRTDEHEERDALTRQYDLDKK